MLDRLTPRQREVYDLYRAGWSHLQIADALFIEPKTVKDHLYMARKTLGITPRRGKRRAVIPPVSADLKPRERQICERARAGLTDRQIATQLGISPHTVKNTLDQARQRYAEQQDQEAA